MAVTETTSLDNLTLSITQEIHIRSSGARVHTASRLERGGAWKLMKGNRE
jgi:hypothetical protein